MPGLTRQEYLRLSIAIIRDHAVGTIIERHVPGLDECPECLGEEFGHERFCTLAETIEESWDKTAQELGPLIYTGSKPEKEDPNGL